ncbi:MAG: hypothetical protein ABJP45_06545 [Cyclobacteriaceae bacterium]
MYQQALITILLISTLYVNKAMCQKHKYWGGSCKELKFVENELSSNSIQFDSVQIKIDAMILKLKPKKGKRKRIASDLRELKLAFSEFKIHKENDQKRVTKLSDLVVDKSKLDSLYQVFLAQKDTIVNRTLRKLNSVPLANRTLSINNLQILMNHFNDLRDDLASQKKEISDEISILILRLTENKNVVQGLVSELNKESILREKLKSELKDIYKYGCRN